MGRWIAAVPRILANTSPVAHWVLACTVMTSEAAVNFLAKWTGEWVHWTAGTAQLWGWQTRKWERSSARNTICTLHARDTQPAAVVTLASSQGYGGVANRLGSRRGFRCLSFIVIWGMRLRVGWKDRHTIVYNCPISTTWFSLSIVHHRLPGHRVDRRAKTTRLAMCLPNRANWRIAYAENDVWVLSKL